MNVQIGYFLHFRGLNFLSKIGEASFWLKQGQWEQELVWGVSIY